MNKNIHFKMNTLEPFTTVFQICLLNFYSNNTKVSIQENKLYFRENSFYQPVIRWFKNESRHDIKQLKCPVVSWMKWMIKNNYVSKYQNILKLLYDGLAKIKNTYNDHVKTVLILDQLMTLIHKLIIGEMNMQHAFFIEGATYDDQYPSIIDTIWINDADIAFVCENFNLLSIGETQYQATYIQIIESFLEVRINTYKNIVENFENAKK